MIKKEREELSRLMKSEKVSTTHNHLSVTDFLKELNLPQGTISNVGLHSINTPVYYKLAKDKPYLAYSVPVTNRRDSRIRDREFDIDRIRAENTPRFNSGSGGSYSTHTNEDLVNLQGRVRRDTNAHTTRVDAGNDSPDVISILSRMIRDGNRVLVDIQNELIFRGNNQTTARSTNAFSNWTTEDIEERLRNNLINIDTYNIRLTTSLSRDIISVNSHRLRITETENEIIRGELSFRQQQADGSDLDIDEVDEVLSLNDQAEIDSYGAYYGFTIPKIKEEVKVPTAKELRKQHFLNTVNTVANLAFIKGYIIRDKVYTNDEDIAKDFAKGIGNKDFSTIKTILKVFSWDDKIDSVTSKLITVTKYSFTRIPKAELKHLIPSIIKMRINNTENSDEIFGSGKTRRAFADSLTKVDESEFKKVSFVEEWSIETSKSTKLGKSSYYISVTDDNSDSEEKTIKFVFKDCDFINPELKGFIPPADKTMKVNTVVSVKPNILAKYCIDPDKNLATILSIKSNASSKRIAKNCKNRRMEIVKISLNSSGLILKVYAQDLRFVSAPKAEYKEEVKKKPVYGGLYSDDVGPTTTFNTSQWMDEFIANQNR